MTKNDVTSFYYYMCCCWRKEECELIFSNSQCPWNHFWGKWVALCKDVGPKNAIMQFYGELSDYYRDLLVSRACDVYDRAKLISE